MTRQVKARTGAGWVSAFAPASVANFGSGFDAFAVALCASEIDEKTHREVLRPLGDTVHARRRRSPGVGIVAIEGDGGRLPKSPRKNCAAVAAQAVLRASRARFGLDLRLVKGLPLSSGLGSSAASAAAGALAAAIAVGGPVMKQDLIAPALAGEHVADGAWHGDNVWASLMGGGVIVVSTRPADLVPIGSPATLRWVTVHPQIELSTRRARAVLPKQVSLADAASQAGAFGALIQAWRTGGRAQIGARLLDRLAEPRRGRLIPGYERAKRAAMRAGAFGYTISGAGPSVIAVTPPGQERNVGEAIRDAFAREGLGADVMVCAVDARGARRVSGKGSRRS